MARIQAADGTMRGCHWPLGFSPLSGRAAAQEQVLSRAQLREYGVDRFRIRNQVAARRWQVYGRAVILHSGALTRRQRWWAALLHAGDGCALAGLTAAEAGGLTGWERERVHLVASRPVPAAALPGVTVHVSRRFADGDLHPVRLPPQTRLPRSLFDAAVWLPRADHACGLLAAGVQQRLVTVAQLRRQLETSGQVRHRRILRAVLLDIEGGSHSLAEINFYSLCRRAGLPLPHRQAIRATPDGRRRYLDGEFDGFSVEVDGAIHLLALNSWADFDRGNELVLVGNRVLRFSSVAYRTQPARVLDQLRRAHAAFGGR